MKLTMMMLKGISSPHSGGYSMLSEVTHYGYFIPRIAGVTLMRYLNSHIMDTLVSHII